MRVYLAAPFVEREAALQAKAVLEKAGHTVTSRWITSHLEDFDVLNTDAALGEAYADLDDIEAAQVLVVLDDFKCSTGRNFEVGYALARGMSVVRVAPSITHIFHHLPSFINVPNIEEALVILEGMDYLPQYYRFREEA